MGIQEEIKVIHVRLTRVSVNSFSLHDQTITLEIDFNDNVPKQVYKTIRIEEHEELATRMLQDIVRMEKNINMEFDGEQLIGAVHVILHKYDEIQRMLVRFLEDVYGKLQKIKNAKSAEGYMDRVRELQRSELKLRG